LIISTPSIVLHQFRYGDSSLIVHLYTEKLGRQSIFVRGAAGKKSQMRAALFQPLYLIETEIHHRLNRNMQRISNARLMQPFHDILLHPVKNAIALFIAEILTKTLREEEANRELFDFLSKSIHAFNLMDKGTANFHLVFLVHLTRYLGFYPNLKEISENAPVALQLSHLSFEQLEILKINHLQRNYLTEYLLSYYAMHVESFGKIKSFPVLQHVFSQE
jgi:DNA repair protein RecO (recombination protein O)